MTLYDIKTREYGAIPVRTFSGMGRLIPMLIGCGEYILMISRNAALTETVPI